MSEHQLSGSDAFGELSVTMGYDRFETESVISSTLSGAGAALDVLT